MPALAALEVGTQLLLESAALAAVLPIIGLAESSRFQRRRSIVVPIPE